MQREVIERLVGLREGSFGHARFILAIGTCSALPTIISSHGNKKSIQRSSASPPKKDITECAKKKPARKKSKMNQNDMHFAKESAATMIVDTAPCFAIEQEADLRGFCRDHFSPRVIVSVLLGQSVPVPSA